MNETLKMFGKVITNPNDFTSIAKEKSVYILIVLVPLNAIIFGLLYIFGHFYIATFLHPLFWMLSLLVGVVFEVQLVGFLGLYLLISRIFREDEKIKSLKVLAFNFTFAYTIYHGILFAIITFLMSAHYYSFAIYFYDISHIIINLWIVALCVQAIQTIRSETEIKTLVKVFASYFTLYGINTLVYLATSTMIIGLVVR